MSMLPLILTDVSLWRDGNMLIEGGRNIFAGHENYRARP